MFKLLRRHRGDRSNAHSAFTLRPAQWPQGALQPLPPGGVDVTDEWGYNLIMYASLAGDAEIVEMLLNADPKGSSLLATVKDGEHEELEIGPVVPGGSSI